jgi:hypothetical protein
MDKIFLNNLYAYVGDNYTYPFFCNCGCCKLEVYKQNEKITLYCNECKKELSFDNFLIKIMSEMFNYQIQVELRRREA